MQRRIIMAVILLIAPVVLVAQSNEAGIFASSSSYSSTPFTDPAMPGHRLEMKFGRGTGLGASYNRYWTPRLSTELAYTTVKGHRRMEMSDGSESMSLHLGDARLRVLSGTAQWHFGEIGALNPYVGAGIARVDGTIDTDHGAEGMRSDDLEAKTNWIAEAGMAYRVSPSFSIALDAKYLPYEFKQADSRDDIDPLIVSAGIRFRF